MEEGFASPKSELRNPASCKKVGLRHAGDGDGRSYDRNVRPEHLQQENYQIPTSCCRQESGLVLITHSPYRVSIRRLGTVNASKSKVRVPPRKQRASQIYTSGLGGIDSFF